MRVLGMISGTSYDAVEAVIADFEHDGDAIVCDMVAHRSVPYPSVLRSDIAAVLPPGTTTIGEVCSLDVRIGQHFGDVAKALCDEHVGVDAVCSHGQTVFHWVQGGVARGCVQLGQPAWIAARTGLPVVSDVRNADIAAGGQGAPLVSLLDVLLLAGSPPAAGPVGSLNLGGIANVTVVGPPGSGFGPPIAFDIGPANALLDAAVQWLTHGAEYFDRDGALAARGTVDDALVARLLDHPYFDAPPPKSTGKEDFNLAYLEEKMAGAAYAPEDLLASLTAATAQIVAGALRRMGVRDLYVAGGGTRNPTLMRSLAERLPGVTLRSTDALGVAEEAKEALLLALIGFLTLTGVPATIPSCTGARRPSVLGVITPGAHGLPPGAGGDPAHGRVPSRLTVRTPLDRSSSRPVQLR
ncbi:MAG: anhydro-N-acetylmuramic acid kinase [Actinomycetota bacterium]|nr:anhydro-N-acetylmuramic acid kinase [Actinomycetota bacterium]